MSSLYTSILDGSLSNQRSYTYLEDESTFQLDNLPDFDFDFSLAGDLSRSPSTQEDLGSSQAEQERRLPTYQSPETSSLPSVDQLSSPQNVEMEAPQATPRKALSLFPHLPEEVTSLTFEASTSTVIPGARTFDQLSFLNVPVTDAEQNEQASAYRTSSGSFLSAYDVFHSISSNLATQAADFIEEDYTPHPSSSRTRGLTEPSQAPSITTLNHLDSRRHSVDSFRVSMKEIHPSWTVPLSTLKISSIAPMDLEYALPANVQPPTPMLLSPSSDSLSSSSGSTCSAPNTPSMLGVGEALMGRKKCPVELEDVGAEGAWSKDVDGVIGVKEQYAALGNERRSSVYFVQDAIDLERRSFSIDSRGSSPNELKSSLTQSDIPASRSISVWLAQKDGITRRARWCLISLAVLLVVIICGSVLGAHSFTKKDPAPMVD